jgi:hypothetical protein
MNMENIGKVTSYTSANALPIKIFKDKELMRSMIEDKKIIPTHVQLVPTNRCNQNCTYCSFKGSDKHLELSKKELGDIVDTVARLGTKAITVTGGGEPLIHPDINWLIPYIRSKGMKVGLVSNGKQLDLLNPDNINYLTWYRISFDTNRKLDDTFISNLDKVVSHNSGCDLAFSYVITKKTNWSDLRRLINYTNDNGFSHLRIVEDIFNPGIMSIDELKDATKDLDTSKVIYQGKKEFTNGDKDCWISLIKPFIGADGYVYPCCGITYAHKDEQGVEPKSMRMGHWSQLADIISNQQNFKGSGCDKCYYPEYNAILSVLRNDIKHEEFI